MRDFVLDDILAKIDKAEVSQADLAVLRGLPVWALHGHEADDVNGYSVIVQSAEDGGGNYLPPADMDDRYVTPSPSSSFRYTLGS